MSGGKLAGMAVTEATESSLMRTGCEWLVEGAGERGAVTSMFR